MIKVDIEDGKVKAKSVGWNILIKIEGDITLVEDEIIEFKGKVEILIKGDVLATSDLWLNI